MKDVQKDVQNVVQEKLTEQESQALTILIEAVKIATKAGTFELDDAVVIGNSKNLLNKLILK
jgi:hypothetical protein